MTKESAKKKDVKVTEQLYQMIRSPIITEKTSLSSQHNQITFRVPLEANKTTVKRAVEGLFKVKVVKVNTLTQKGKTKVFKGRKHFRTDVKKAIVTLAEGQTIDVATGI